MHSLYRRPLPPPLVAFASPAGRALFDAARASGGMSSFFPLIEQHHTQADPAFCGLGSLVVVLNALGVDPGRLWKGPWRWFSEELLDCCASLERVRSRGITLDELACLARCNGASADVRRADSESDLRAAVAAAAASELDPALVVAYDRAALGQTGGGHFSPVGGYDRASDHVLVLDVARFKYPPHWVPLPALHAAMQPLDPATGRPRGYVALRRSDRPASLLFTARCSDGGLEGFSAALAGLLADLAAAAPTDVPAALRVALAAAARLPLALERRALALHEHAAAAEALLADLRAAPVHAAAAAHAVPPWDPDAAALLLLALPDEVWSPLAADLRAALRALLDPAGLPAALRDECEHIRRQLADLTELTRGSCSRCG
ncbi:MAG: phytochelatin synthase family protein [Myxococcales bacterium]|nr:phytochelatin synthase family protein [Myxococcales bacterium]